MPRIRVPASFLLACLVGLIGCSKTTPPSPAGGAGGGSISFTKFKDVNPAAGIEKAEASFGNWEKGMAFVLLSDVVGISGTNSSAATGRPSRYHGHHSSSDGRRVEWECETADGKTGTIKINGEPYELERGSFFLISARGGEVRVRQLKRGTLQLEHGHEGVEKLAKDEEVGKFFSAGK